MQINFEYLEEEDSMEFSKIFVESLSKILF